MTYQPLLDGAGRPVMSVRDYVRERLADLSLRQAQRDARRARRRAVGETEARERRAKRQRRAAGEQMKFDEFRPA